MSICVFSCGCLSACIAVPHTIIPDFCFSTDYNRERFQNREFSLMKPVWCAARPGTGEFIVFLLSIGHQFLLQVIFNDVFLFVLLEFIYNAHTVVAPVTYPGQRFIAAYCADLVEINIRMRQSDKFNN